MKKITVLFLSLILISKLFSQVNFQSGGATFGLPLFNWQDDKSRLNFSVSLSYSSGNGLKVNDVSSNIGQGWNLLAGGAISRMQVGEPDDQKPYGDNTSSDYLNKYPAGYLYNPVDPGNGCPASLTRYPIFHSENQLYKNDNITAADLEQDHFAYQINGRSGFFVLGKNNGDKGVLLQDGKIKIWFQRNENAASQGIRTTISAFFLQDENGLVYKFDKVELTKVLKTKYCDASLKQSLTEPSFKEGNVYNDGAFDNNDLTIPYTVNSWLLTQVTDPLTGRSINITYATNQITANAGTSITHYTEKKYVVISHNFSKTQTPEIAAISYPDGHSVNFNYGAARIDLQGDKVLSSVDILYQGRYLSKYQLNSAYFILNRVGTPANDFQKSVARLCLQSVKKIGVDLKDEEPPYKFEYFTGSSAVSADVNEQALGLLEDIVPPPFFHLKDIWGYYNGNNSVAYDGTTRVPVNKPLSQLNADQLKGLCFMRNNSTAVALNAKAGYAKNGLLKKIMYPTGGTLNYQYDQNVGIIAGQTVNAAGVHVSSASVTDGSTSGNLNDCNNPIVTNYSYKDDAGLSTLWGLETPVNAQVTSSHYETELRKWKWWSPGCSWYFKYPGILSREQANTITGHQKFLMAFAIAMEVVSTIMDVVDIISVCLKATPAAIVAIVIDIISVIIGIVLSCRGHPSQDAVSTVHFNSDRNNNNPLPIQFRQVTVSESSGTNGKTVLEFTSPTADYYPLWVPENTNVNFSMKQRYPSFAYGLPLKTTIKDAANNIIKQTFNTYSTGDADLNRYIAKGTVYNPTIEKYNSCNCIVDKSTSQRNTEWQNLSTLAYQTNLTGGDMHVEFYQNHIGHIDLFQTSEKVFKTGSNTDFLETLTQYNYNPNYLANLIYTTKSNGDRERKDIIYNGDNTFNSAIQGDGILGKLMQDNIYSIPISTINSVIKAGQANEVMLNESVNEFSVLANGNIKPSRTLEQRFAGPLPGLSFSNNTTYKGPNNSSNPAYKETQTFTYDATGNLVGLRDEGYHIVTNLYDYNDKYVVASVVNAEPIIDKAAYCSFETANLGGWTISGTTSLTASSAITGTNSLLLSSSNNLTAPVNTLKPYTLSYWSNSGAMTVNNSNLLKTGPVLNGYTYYEYLIPAGNSSVTIINSAAKNIDELRLYPQTSRMRTVTYDPLIGKTSECDENNRITYYEYDELGRLRFIKDESKNIIKMYEYNYAKKLNACNTTFTNLKIVELYYKNNCAAGYIGAPYVYTIAAGKYTSTINQDAVDRQVEYELDAQGQLAANTNGSCIQQWGNSVATFSYVKNNCGPGYVGGNVKYTVAANTYFSTESQAAADALATFDMNASGQAFANTSGMANCTATTTADWESTGAAQCEVSGANYTGNQLTQFIDENPNSSTYNNTQWINTGTTNSSACSGAAKLNITYNNTTAVAANVIFTNQSDGLQYYLGAFAKNYTGTAGAIPAGIYNISITPSITGFYTFSYQVGTATAITVSGTSLSNITVNATINFVINSITYQNTAISQSYLKGNCNSGYSATVVYTVPLGIYTSAVSQPDAQSKAQADITANGQSFADANGICTLTPPPPPPTNQCWITSAPGWNMNTSGMSLAGSTVTFYTVESCSAAPNWTVTTALGYINGPCNPSDSRIINFNENSRTWQLLINPTGGMYIRLVSGPTPVLPFTLGIPSSSFNL